MIRSIMVPLDGSRFGEHALPLALALARRAEATLQLVHVHQAMPPASIAGVVVLDDAELLMQKEELAYLDKVVRRLTEVAPVQVTTALLQGEVVSALQAALSGSDAMLREHAAWAAARLGRDDLVEEARLPATGPA